MMDRADNANEPVLVIEGLRTQFDLDEGLVRAVDGVDLAVPSGQTLALVGESGCGKTVLAYSVLRLVQPPGRIVSGSIRLSTPRGPVELTALPARDLRRIRGKQIAMIFQEPMSSLSPVHTVGSQVAEAIRIHERIGRAEAGRRAVAMMDRAGIPDPARRARQFPHELSGGLRQRAMIAMALACQPRLLIADEPTTALDVTIQAQILQLLRDIQRQMGMSVLIITHDLGVVAQMAQQVAVMYRGRIVELADVDSLFYRPRHPYTRALLRSIPGLVPAKSQLQVIPGSVPEPFEVVPGCAFHPRCERAQAGLCDVGDAPPLERLCAGQWAACRRETE